LLSIWLLPGALAGEETVLERNKPAAGVAQEVCVMGLLVLRRDLHTL
jgi:hypothetical protein